MLGKCPICGKGLIKGKTTANVHEYTSEDEIRFKNGLTLAEVRELELLRPQFYFCECLCDNKGNGNTITNKDGSMPMNPPCPNYHGGNLSNPKYVVKTEKIYDN